MGPCPEIDLLETLSSDVVRACDYLRLWELLYDAGPSEYKAVRGAVYASLPAEVMQRIRMGEETVDDMLKANACVLKQRDWHRAVLESRLTWGQWTCWKLEPLHNQWLSLTGYTTKMCVARFTSWTGFAPSCEWRLSIAASNITR